MYVRSLLAASALSLNAAAFLVVPEVLPPLEDGENANAPIPHISHAVDMQNVQAEQVQLACDGCPFPTADSDGLVSWSSDTQSSLVSLLRPEQY